MLISNPYVDLCLTIIHKLCVRFKESWIWLFCSIFMTWLALRLIAFLDLFMESSMLANISDTQTTKSEPVHNWDYPRKKDALNWWTTAWSFNKDEQNWYFKMPKWDSENWNERRQTLSERLFFPWWWFHHCVFERNTLFLEDVPGITIIPISFEMTYLYKTAQKCKCLLDPLFCYHKNSK